MRGRPLFILAMGRKPLCFLRSQGKGVGSGYDQQRSSSRYIVYAVRSTSLSTVRSKLRKDLSVEVALHRSTTLLVSCMQDYNNDYKQRRRDFTIHTMVQYGVYFLGAGKALHSSFA